MYRRSRWLGPLVLFVAVSVSGCGGSQFVLVDLLRGTSIGAGETFTSFSVTIDVLGETSSLEIANEMGGAISLPTSFSAELPGRLVGQVLVNVAGLNGSTVTATGAAASKLSGSETSVIVTMEAGGGPICGNGSVEAGEQCDDGNTTSGDGCSDTCQVEIPPGCGDGVVDPGEDCDDSGVSATCDLDCTLAECGDTTLNTTAGEQCDDGNTVSGDGCDDACQIEMMMGFCGDGTLDAGEQCDDGNTTPGDGCDDMCQIEAGPVCGGDGGAVSCGDVVAGDTAMTGINDAESYACVGFMNAGPEMTYVFTPTLNDTLQVDLTGLAVDLDLFVLQDAGGGCDPATCGPGMFSGIGGLGDEQVLIPVTAGNVYYLVVESFDTTGGAFTLGVSCASNAVCGNGAIEAGETCDDGNTNPGDGCDPSCQIEPCSFLTNGDLVVATSMNLPAGVYDFGLLQILPGATLTFTGMTPVEIWAENVFIEGTIDVRGDDGLDIGPFMAPHGGDAGPAGGGGGGGGICNFNPWPVGMGGAPNGQDGIPMGTPGEGDGGGGGLAMSVPASVPNASGGFFGSGGAGGGGGNAAPGESPPDCCGGTTPGGAPYSDMMMSLFTGGGGGGGGGANGGGGGGGGGAMRIISRTLFIGTGGLIDASGGGGGLKSMSGACTSGGGGGGAGGMVWLEAETLDIAGSVFAFGGPGGGPDPFTLQAGGAGSDGRIQIATPNANTPGMIAPAPFTRPDPPACR